MAFRGVEPKDHTARIKVARNEAWLDEFLGSDIIVIGAPMYNFSLPSQLKSWLDRIVVAGKTFGYSEAGVKGLVEGKKVIVASSRGGMYSTGAPAELLDYQEKYLDGILGFIGIKDATYIRAEGLALAPAVRDAAIKNALSKVEGIGG